MGTKLLPVAWARRTRGDPRPWRRHRQWVAIGVAVALAACGGGGGDGGPAGPNPPPPDPPGQNPPAGNTVVIQDNLFNPTTRNVTVGTTVRWVNNGGAVHNTTSNTGAWTNPNMNPNAEFTHTFNTTGTFPYRCTLHAGMTGTIVVGT